MKNKLNCIIIHGCPSSPEEFINMDDPGSYPKHWIPYIKKGLIQMGIKTETPLMPSPWEPVYEDFKKEFEKYEVNDSTVLIGHSCGCAFLVRWLGESKQKIKKLILVAPWKIPYEDGGFRDRFYIYPIDETIKSRVEEIVIFTSDNEEEDGKKSVKLFYDVLGGKVIGLKGKGHYVFKHMGTEEFPELLEEVIKNNRMEYIDILDNQGNKLGISKSKSEVHHSGLWHRVVHVWFLNSNNEILLQHRSKEKEVFPNVWDVSVGGHVSKGEDSNLSAIRETEEEIGINVSELSLEFLGTIKKEYVFKNGEYIDNEFSDIYLVTLDIDINKIKIQKEELDQLRWMSLSDFKIWVEEKNINLFPRPEEYELLLEKLK